MVLLEADLDMKKQVARLIHPDTELGDRFWHTFYSRCETPQVLAVCKCSVVC